MAIGKELALLEEKIGYKFADIKNLQTAMTHSSYANEQKSKGLNYPSNERFEFLGDAVLEMVISEYLFVNYKDRSEGTLTKMRQSLVCEKTLAKIASHIGLGEYINLGRGEELTDCRLRPKVLADALEALFAALYLDSRISKTNYTNVIIALFSGEIENALVMQKGDFKTLLQQLVEKDGSSLLEYEVINEDGPEHDKIFTVAAKVNNNVVGVGKSKSKKDAEMEAAKLALELFGVLT
jgi:ribonuclease-3